MSIIGTIYEDVTTDVLGKIGSWQWLVTFISTSHMMLAMFNQYEDIFLIRPSEIYCILPNDENKINSSLCVVTLQNNGTEDYRCNKWHLKFLWFIWLKKTWLVFCDQKLKLLSTAIISRFGLVFGFIIFGLIADSFGRRMAMILDVITELILGLVITFCDSEGWFRLVVFLRSLLGSASFFMGLILVCEIASNSWRSWLCVIVMSPRLLSLACLVPIANSAQNTETFSFISCIYAVICMTSLVRWGTESPQWLLHNRKIHVAELILIKAAKTNGIKLCQEFKIRPVNHRAYDTLDEANTCIGMLSIHNIRVLFFASVSFWMLYYFIWSSVYVRLYSEHDAEYSLWRVLCFVSILGCLTKYSSAKLTLRYLLMINIFITGVFTAGSTYTYKSTVSSILSSIALSSGLVAHALVLNITPRLFATNIRATAVGFCHATGQIGSIISYLLFLFHPISNTVIMVIELGVTLIIIGLLFIFPDVDQRELPDVMKDMDYFSELSKPLRWVTQKTNSPSLEEMEMRVYSFGSDGRRPSTSNVSEVSAPAQQIGFIRLSRAFINY
ncbi:hypothetical protein HF086_016847 [Spodoptera exigua]|uniref:Uncharacterized protein n=1 Tax=Spodoptera exigua TaxID=7107 RepID=A0A922S8G6_SPOEX|nr:hypothetical protein HF086_016847 [Spodoptera exigua]